MDLGNGIQKSIDLYLKNFGILFIAGLLVTILSIVTIGIIAGPLVAGFLIMIQKLLQGEKVDTNELFAHFDQFVPTLIVGIIVFVISIIFCAIPGIRYIYSFLIMPVISFIYVSAIGYIVNKKSEPIDAIKQGYALFMANPGMNWLYCFIINLLSMIGVIACGIGVILTCPISMVGFTLAYQELSEKMDTSAGPPVSA